VLARGQQNLAQVGEGVALEDAQRARLQPPGELAVDREGDQREARASSDQHADAERPGEWIHGALVAVSGAALSPATPPRTTAGAGERARRRPLPGEASAGNAKPPAGAGAFAPNASPRIRRRSADGPPARRRPSARCRRRGNRT